MQIQEQQMKDKIIAEDVSFYYGSNQAIRNISLKVKKNSVMALIGPSGCGKSTFLRCINRMNDIIPETKITGDIKIDDVSIYGSKYNVTALRRKVGMVFQKSNPFPKSIFENIAYGLKINGVKDKYEIEYIVENP
jgi:phosphate transport system ATP-binding protein